MANFGRRPITDANKPLPRLTYQWDGEERIDRRPLGKVERFVDPQGNVVSLQLASDGDPQKVMTADRQRITYRRDGFIEHAKCPLRHGTHLLPGTIAKDFSTLPDSLATPCEGDPRTLIKRGHNLHATEACPHIEWLIKARVEKERAQNARRNANRMAEERREEKRRKFEDLQLRKAEQEMAALEEADAAATTVEPRKRRARADEPSE